VLCSAPQIACAQAAATPAASAGTSAGASYASGMPLAQIEREMSLLRTQMLFRDVDRVETPLRDKINDATNYIGPEFGITSKGTAFPKGLVAGVSIEAVLRQLTVRQRADVVIAVNIGMPLRTRAEICGILTVSDQISRILTANNVNQSLKELGRATC